MSKMRGPFKEVSGYQLPSDQRPRFAPGRYRVMLRFVDNDSDEHQVGREWTVEETLFVPYDDELLLIVALDDKLQHYVIPLTYSNAAQADVIENFPNYAVRLDGISD